jgi:hypothetical protein
MIAQQPVETGDRTFAMPGNTGVSGGLREVLSPFSTGCQADKPAREFGGERVTWPPTCQRRCPCEAFPLTPAALPDNKVRRTQQVARRRRGAAAAELAIVLPFLALAFAVVLDFCRVYHVTQAIQASAQAGAFYASGTAVADVDTTAAQAAKDAAVAEAAGMRPPIDPARVAVTNSGSTATVTVSYDFPLLTPLLGKGGTVMITRSATMNVAP